MKEIYFINTQGAKAGPIEITEVSRYPINGETMVWSEGMPQWKKASEVPEVSVYIKTGTTPPPPPHGAYAYNGIANSSNVIEEKPDNYLWLSILSTVLCCIPLGIVGILNSNQVDNKWNSGDHEGAVNSSKNALLFSLIAVGLGVVVGMFGLIIGIASS